jgi:hypothetical protein
MTKVVPKVVTIDAPKGVTIEDLFKESVFIRQNRLKSLYDLSFLFVTDPALSVKFAEEGAASIRMLLLIEGRPRDYLGYSLKPSVEIERQ